MLRTISPGARFRAALEAERPLQIAGAINAYCALLAKRAGFRALYLSGAGVANASRGLPDLGVTTLDDVLTDARRITGVTAAPLLVDADTGWGDPARTVRELTAAGVAGLHLEDQVEAKRCGHRPNKQLVSPDEMVTRIVAAVVAKSDPDFVIMARTDALAVEGLEAALARARRYIEAGAEMIFAEACTTLDEFAAFTRALDVPVLPNITEFGKTPLFTIDELRGAGIAMVLYPLSAFRAMNTVAVEVYRAIRANGTQRAATDLMQTREELYEVLNYHGIEEELDRTQKS
ncbi:MAG TPA: methylisocitrate lyase [Chthoniobacteraceae bacterium]|nr:methylisocitrate lyase [Chthoniobacteraceae bacterium]